MPSSTDTSTMPSNMADSSPGRGEVPPRGDIDPRGGTMYAYAAHPQQQQQFSAAGYHHVPPQYAHAYQQQQQQQYATMPPPPGYSPYGYAPAQRSGAFPAGTAAGYGYDPGYSSYPTQQPHQQQQQQQTRKSPPRQRQHDSSSTTTPPRSKTAAAAATEVKKESSRALEVPSSAITKTMEEFEAERLRQAAATELELSTVKPIQTDFVFFVQDMREKLKLDAEQEVRQSTNGQRLDPYLVNTNLNARLYKAWQDLSKAERDKYMKKEEEDRRRFMEEEEVASRHCATLTARATSPSKRSPEKKDSPDREGNEGKRSPEELPKDEASPSKKNRTDDDEEEV